MARIKFGDIVEELSAIQWKVLSTEYKNLDSEMEFQCPEGHHFFTSWKKLRGNYQCPICATNQYKDQEIKVTPKKKGEYRILALDQATKNTGWAIYSDKKLLVYGVQSAVEGGDAVARDHQMKEWAISMAHTWDIDMVAIEGIQMQTTTYGNSIGVTTFEALARLQGILLEAFYCMKIPCIVCPTNTWRAHCGVKGKARADKKASMRLLVKQWYDITVNDDCADAIGIGKYAADKRIPSKAIDWE